MSRFGHIHSDKPRVCSGWGSITVLSDHERRQLALIEQEFMARDPAYVARWCSLARKVRRAGLPLRTRPRARRPAGHATGPGTTSSMVPIVLLASGLVFLLIGGALAEPSVVVVGILLAITALGIAIVAPRQSPRPDTA